MVRSTSRSESYVPKKGDIVWIDFDPQSGREQAGRRPALVISSTMYNRRVRLALVCPITSKVKGYAFEVQSQKDWQYQELCWPIRLNHLIGKHDERNLFAGCQTTY